MKQRKTIIITIYAFYVIILTGCASHLTYEPKDNPNILGAMESIRNKILAQSEKRRVPSKVEITENTLKIVGNFEGLIVKHESSPVPISAYSDAVKYQKYKNDEFEKPVGLINFKDIAELELYESKGWFIVTLLNTQKILLFKYFSLNENEAKQFMNDVHTLIRHKVETNNPIHLSSKAPLRPLEIIARLTQLESLRNKPDAEVFAALEPELLSEFENLEILKNDSDEVGKYANGLAEVYQSLGKYEEAEPLYLKSLAIKEKDVGKDHFKTVDILDNLTRLYAEQGRFEQAEIFAQKSLAIKEKSLGKEDTTLIASLNNLSAIYQVRGRYVQSEKMNQRSLAIMESVVKSGHIEQLAETQKGVLQLLQRAYITPTIGMESFAKGVNGASAIVGVIVTGIIFANTLITLMDNDVLANPQNKHRKIANISALAEIYYAQGRYAEAESKFKEALKINKNKQGNDHTDVAKSLTGLAKVYYAQDKYQEAEPLLQQALAINEKKLGQHHPTVADDLNYLALIQAAQNKHEQAKLLFQRSLRIMNQVLEHRLWGAGEKTRQAYIQQQEAKRDFYLSFYSLTNAADEALYYSLNRKGMLLRISSEASALAKQSTNPEVQKLTQEFNAQRTKLSEHYLAEKIDLAEIQKVEEGSNNIEQQLSQLVSGFKRSKTEITPAQVLEKLTSEESVIDFLVYKDFDFKNRKVKSEQVIALIANKQKGVQLIKLGDLVSIETAIKAYRKEIETNQAVKISSRVLYDRVWQPLTSYLQNTKTVYLIPDGPLHLLPFKALHDQDGKYLAEKLQLITLSSAQDIVLPKETGRATTAAIFAAPDFGNESAFTKNTNRAVDLKSLHFSDLPGTLEEGEQIKRLFTEMQPDSSMLLFLKQEAKEQIVKTLQSPKILHLATHGFFLEDSINSDDKTLERGLMQKSNQAVAPLFIENPLARAGLALSGANQGIKGIKQADKSDGILTALEVLNLNLEGTDLVVLSACETGIGDVKVGEGVYSLNRSFQEVGAKAVLSTLWSVDDKATVKFMQKFYTRFLEGKPAQMAIQETQNEFIHDKQYNDPYYWAGFVMMGKE